MAKGTKTQDNEQKNIAGKTNDKNDPVVGKMQVEVTNKAVLRTVDRTTKDAGTWRSAHIAAESIYYPNQSRLYDLYEDVRLDGHLSGIMQKRIDQVLNKTILFKVGEDKIDEMDKVIDSEVFRRILTSLMERKFWGLSGLEFIPGDKLAFNPIPRKHIKLKTQKITYEQFGLDDGIDYTTAKNLWVLGDHHDFGLLLKCSYYALLKKGMMGDWASYIELFGSPVIVLKYDGYNRDDKIAGEKILQNSGNSQKILIPKTMDWDMKDGKLSNGDGKLQETFRLAANQEMSLIVLGNTETSAAGQHGSEGKSKTHSDQQKEIMKSDMKYITYLLNSDHFMEILRSYNLPIDGGHFEFDKEADIDYLRQKQPIDVAFINLGLPVPKKYLYDTYSIPEPEEGDDVIHLEPVTPSEPSGTGEPDGDEGKPKKPTPKKKTVTQPKALADNTPATIADVKALLTDFFAQPS